MRELQTKKETKIEQVKLQVVEIQKVFDSKLLPQKNHILFEVNLLENNINVAEFDEIPILKWEDAVSGNYRNQRKITKKPNCVYISSMNEKNVHKILKRDHNIILTQQN